MLYKKIGIIDYDAGNLFALYNACKQIEFSPEIIKRDSYKNFKDFDVIILPGVGSFYSAMTKIKKFDLFQKIIEFKNSGKLLVGICLGMQLMCSNSSEGKSIEGFKFIDEEVTSMYSDIKKLKKSLIPRVPITGWNSVYFNKDYKFLINNANKNFNKIDFYFIHSYWLKKISNNFLVSESEYMNTRYCSCFKKENIIGVQFHPERSGKSGLVFLKKLINIKC